MDVTIYHNPRCSKSRQTLALLEEHGIKPKIINYLEQPPSRTELRRILHLLGIKAQELLRKKESEFKQARLDDPGLSEDAIIDAMLKYPRLIERPIVVTHDKAAIGRPPENVIDILPS